MNPLWVEGKSGNPAGRPRNSVRTVKGKIERFINGQITPNRLRRIFDELSAKDQMDALTTLLPYVMSKKPAESSITAEEVDKLYEMVTAQQKANESKAI